jgi:hypothetical protein
MTWEDKDATSVGTYRARHGSRMLSAARAVASALAAGPAVPLMTSQGSAHARFNGRSGAGTSFSACAAREPTPRLLRQARSKPRAALGPTCRALDERAWIDEWSGRGRSEGWCTSAVRPVVRAAVWQMLFFAAGGVTALPAAPRRWCDTRPAKPEIAQKGHRNLRLRVEPYPWPRDVGRPPSPVRPNRGTSRKCRTLGRSTGGILETPRPSSGTGSGFKAQLTARQ